MINAVESCCSEKRENIRSHIFALDILCEYLIIFPFRQYEEKQLKTQKERSERRLEFSNQKSKLKSQVWLLIDHIHAQLVEAKCSN